MAKSEAWVMVSKLDKDKTSCVLEMYPLVLCKDCKKHDTYDCNITYLTTQKTPDNWFCADGEHKELEGAT